LWVLQGRAALAARGQGGRRLLRLPWRCRRDHARGCHSHPVFDEATGRPIDLAGRINSCRAAKQQAEPLAPESDELLALTIYVARQSHGMPVTPVAGPRLAPSRDNGRRLFESRFGQLDLSCASCHDKNWGKRLGGSTVPQAHPTGYPLYR
jgi:L-cysteine S-thiosulfotransferase